MIRHRPASLEALPDLARHSGGKRIKVFSKAQAEAVVEALERIGADFDSLRSMNPLLVYAQGAGFGQGLALSGFWAFQAPAQRCQRRLQGLSDGIESAGSKRIEQGAHL